MSRFIFLFYIAVLLQQSNSRKYDIEEECRKLYGENLNKVLKRFRRTPDYLKILDERMAGILSQNADVLTQVTMHENAKMKDKINEMFNLTTNADFADEPGDGKRMLQRMYHRNFDIGPYLTPRKHVSRSNKKKGKRQGEEETPKPEEPKDIKPEVQASKETTTLSPIEVLDKEYSTGKLTVAEKNMFKDLGFEYAGKIIHSLIASMDDDASKSTKSDAGGNKYTLKHSTVTEHVHEVTTTQEPETTAGSASAGEGEGDNTYLRNHLRSPHRKPRVFL